MNHPSTTVQRGDRITPWALGLGSLVIQIPFLDRGISLYDEGSILAIADALHKGEVLYRDRITPLGPLTYELMRVLFDLFGSNLIVGRILQAIVFSACVVLVHRVLLELTAPRWALCGALAFLSVKPLAFPLWTIVNYSQLAMLFCLLSVLAMLRFLADQRTSWLAAAGLGIGMTIITKQNLGVFLAATLAAALALDALRERRNLIAQLGMRAVILVTAVLPPLLAVAAFYAAQGTFGDLLDRAVVGLLYLVQPYKVSIPWSYGSGELGPIIFTYFPTPLAHLLWQGRLNLFSPIVFLSIGHAVKATYFAPLAALLLGIVFIARDWRFAVRRADWSRLVVIVAFASMAYASMLYRADWTHLMNVSPPMLILCVVVLHRIAGAAPWTRWIAVAICGAWLAVGCLEAVAVFAAYSVPVDTPRGRLLAPRSEAEDSGRVLTYLSAQRRDARILFLRAEPLYYFLSDRRIPTALDLVMPGLLGPGDDERLSRSLTAVDQVIYNPKLWLTVPSPITAYAPQTATTLSTNFRVAEIVSPNAYVLTPAAAPSSDITVVDLWQDWDQLRTGLRLSDRVTLLASDQPQPVRRTSWMVYRVVAATVRQHNVRACFETQRTIGDNEAIATTPMLDPVTWAQRQGDPDFNPEVTGASFEITAHSGSGPPTTLFSEERMPGKPNPIRVPLAAFAGQEVEIRFCVSVPRTAPRGPVLAPAGWAEPRIVRPRDAAVSPPVS